jgi:hypothetical protein
MAGQFFLKPFYIIFLQDPFSSYRVVTKRHIQTDGQTKSFNMPSAGMEVMSAYGLCSFFNGDNFGRVF